MTTTATTTTPTAKGFATVSPSLSALVRNAIEAALEEDRADRANTWCGALPATRRRRAESRRRLMQAIAELESRGTHAQTLIGTHAQTLIGTHAQTPIDTHAQTPNGTNAHVSAD